MESQPLSVPGNSILSTQTGPRDERTEDMDWLQNGQAGLNPGLHTLSKFL